MRNPILTFLFVTAISCISVAQATLKKHPDTKEAGWKNLFKPDISDAAYAAGVWTVDQGVLTASEDQPIWSAREYANFVLDLEFKTAPGTNSGVFVYCSDKKDFVPNSVEIQIADDYAEQWANSPKSWQCGAIFGRKPATKSNVKKAGEWNRCTITCEENMIYVLMNGEQVNQINMKEWTSPTTNPDGTEIPKWLNKPLASMPTRGYIGFQGKHAGAPIYFRNIKVRQLK
jgi:hypothetical protein